MEPTALTRIATALERIADRLEHSEIVFVGELGTKYELVGETVEHDVFERVSWFSSLLGAYKKRQAKETKRAKKKAKQVQKPAQ